MNLQAMKAFIESNFRILDINGDGIVGIEEFRYNCITRMAIDDVAPIDQAFEALLTVSEMSFFFLLSRPNQRALLPSLQDGDRKVGGLNLERYKELYGEFLSNTDDKHPAVNLFGPL